MTPEKLRDLKIGQTVYYYRHSGNPFDGDFLNKGKVTKLVHNDMVGVDERSVHGVTIHLKEDALIHIDLEIEEREEEKKEIDKRIEFYQNLRAEIENDNT